MFRKMGLTLTICGLACAANAVQKEGAPTLDALEARIKAAHAAQDCDAMMDLFYTEGVDLQRKKAFAETIVNYVCGNFDRKINSIAVQDIPAETIRKPADYLTTHSENTLPPEGAIMIDYAYSDFPGRIQSFSLLYGKHDNKYYLITTRQAETH